MATRAYPLSKDERAWRGDDPQTLYINRWDSRCGNCGWGADPCEKSHETLLPGYSSVHPEQGCGMVWTKVASDYAGMKAPLSAWRPDLEWSGYDE